MAWPDHFPLCSHVLLKFCLSTRPNTLRTSFLLGPSAINGLRTEISECQCFNCLVWNSSKVTCWSKSGFPANVLALLATVRDVQKWTS